jgi:hypothetical protein
MVLALWARGVSIDSERAITQDVMRQDHGQTDDFMIVPATKIQMLGTDDKMTLTEDQHVTWSL